MKKAELYHGSVKEILLNENPLNYLVFNYWNIVSVLINSSERTLYQSNKGYFINLNGKRTYLTVVPK